MRAAHVEGPAVVAGLRNLRVQLIAIILLGAALRLWGLGAYSLWYDECASLYLGNYLSEPTALFDSARNTEPPLNAVITGLWSRVVSVIGPDQTASATRDFLLRLLPCFFGILNIALVYAVAARLFAGTTTARFAALLFAIAPLQIYYAQELRIYSPYITLSLCALWSMATALRENRLHAWAGYVVSLALLMYSHYIAMWTIFALNVAFVLMLWKHKALIWRWTAANAVLMLLIAPSLMRAFTMHAEVQALESTWYPNPTWNTALLTFKNFFAGYSPYAWAYWPLLMLALALWIVGMRFREKAAEGPILVACLTWIPVAGCTWVWGTAEFSFYEHRLFLFSGVAALIGVAHGAARLGRPGTVALGTVIVLMLPGLFATYQGRLHPIHEHRLGVSDKVDYRSAVQALEAQWRPGDRLVYANLFSAYPLFYYFPHDQVQIGWDADTEAYLIRHLGNEPLLRNHGLLPTVKEEAITGATRLWYLRTYGNTFESQEFSARIQGWLDRIATKEQTLQFSGISLDCYVPGKQ